MLKVLVAPHFITFLLDSVFDMLKRPLSLSDEQIRKYACIRALHVKLSPEVTSPGLEARKCMAD